MTRGCIALAAALAAVCTAPAETVKTASQPWVTNLIEQAVAPLATTNDIAALAARFDTKADAETEIPIRGAWTVTPSTTHTGLPYFVAETNGMARIEFYEPADGRIHAYSHYKPCSPTTASISWTYPDEAGTDFTATRTVDAVTARPVYSNSKLVIREVSAANGQRQFRLIRCE